MLVACVSTKGGCSKTTLATNLACIAASQGKSVLLVDGDLQRSSIFWRGERSDDAPSGIQVVGMPTNTIHKDLPRLAASYDFVCIDVGGRDTNVLRSALLACGKGVVRPEGGIAIIPCQASQFDLWGLSDTMDILDAARTFTEIDSYSLLTQIVHGTSSSKKALTTIAALEKVPLLKTLIHSRVAYKNAVETGLGVIESEPKGRAAGEILSLWKELCEISVKMKGESA